ncbi:hypothetical protein G7Y89_g9933 [Cudoniella acicularis]|uniref:Potassium channel tetramerisation-type BTB domain-containing protein n=1 Tax=Cudoniella acicularis TaxID=354080 RepID=A0A8H4RDQ8_9HELO|nr:hypothetical protein G7Y89_g9933 [Cudoniella acicularis]
MPSPDLQSPVTGLLVCNIVLIVLSTLSVAVRFYTRFFIIKRPEWDDLFAALGYFSAMVECIAVCVSTRFGLGQHISTVSPSDLIIFRKITFFTSLAYVASFVSSKLVFVSLYFRIFPTTLYRNINFGLAAILVAQYIEETLVVFLSCSPLAKLWNPNIPGKCVNLLTFYYASFGVKLVTDLVLFCMPIPMLRTLRIPRAKKVGVMFLFSIGLLIIRAAYLKNTTVDETYLLIAESEWSSTEVCALVICSSIPSFRAFARPFPFLNKFFSSYQSTEITSDQQPSHRLRPWDVRSKSTPFSSNRADTTTTGTVDNESQEEILSVNGKADHNGIPVTSTVNVCITEEAEVRLSNTVKRTSATAPKLDHPAINQSINAWHISLRSIKFESVKRSAGAQINAIMDDPETSAQSKSVPSPPSNSRQITLQAGERRFVTVAETLTHENGSYFIDADPELFEHILRYLRRGVLPIFYDRVKGHNYSLYLALLGKAKYFQILRLENWLKRK